MPDSCNSPKVILCIADFLLLSRCKKWCYVLLLCIPVFLQAEKKVYKLLEFD